MSNVDKADELVASILASSDPMDQPAVYQVDANSESLDSITRILSAHNDLNSLQIVSHGSDARIRIGDAYIDSQNIDSHESVLRSWAQSLHEEGDLLFFGCDIASSTEGQLLIEEIAKITQADVAASTDLTGHVDFNGNWELEYRTGEIERDDPLLGKEQADNWERLLAVINVTTFNDVVDAPSTGSTAALLSNPGADGLISLREALEAANAGDSDDEVVLAAGTYTLSHSDGDLEILGELTITGQGLGVTIIDANGIDRVFGCLLYTSPSPRDKRQSRMPSSA